MFNLFGRNQATKNKRVYKPSVTVVEQPANLGRSDRWVPAVRRSEFPTAPLTADVNHSIDVRPNATQHIEVKTSAVDRAKGFLLSTIPLYAAFALLVTFLAKALVHTPVLSFWGFLTFWLTFVLAWLWGYRESLNKSAEGIAYMEASRKWDVIEREQDRRWEHYDRMLGSDD